MTLIEIFNKYAWVGVVKKLLAGGVFTTDGNGKDAGRVVTAKCGELTTQGAITGTGAGTGFILSSKSANIQIIANGSHAGTTTVDVEVSLDGGTTWGWGATLTVTGASTTDEFHADPVWGRMRYNCTVFGSAGSVGFITEEL